MTIGEAKEKTDEIGKLWLFNSRVLMDDKTLIDYQIGDNSVIIFMENIY